MGGITKYDTGKKTDLLAVVLKKNFFLCQRDIMLICCYVPPANSSYLKKNHIENPFDDLQLLLAEIDWDSYDVIICGDLNSRSKDNDDFGHCTDIPGLNYLANEDRDASSLIERNNRDKNTNSYGKELLEIAIGANVTIRNGRTIGDMFGEYTHMGYQGLSTVDYFLASKNIQASNTTLKVGKFTEFSDHAPLTFSLLNLVKECPVISLHAQEDAPTKYRWTEDDKQKFIATQAEPEIKELIENLSDLHTNTEEDVLQLNDAIVNILHKIADTSLTKPTRSNHPKKKKKKWFDNECRTAKKILRKTVNHFNKDKQNINARYGVYSARKEYRSIMNRKSFQFRLQMNKEIEGTHLNNIDWSILKKLRSNSTDEVEFDEYDLESFYMFFKNLYNEASPIPQEQRKIHHLNSLAANKHAEDHTSAEFEELNKDITLKELSTAISGLSNGKSVSLDLISNEMIKNLNDEMKTTILKLFNICLHRGIYPWRSSSITPILKSGDPYDPDNYRAIALGSCIGKLFSTILLTRITEFRKFVCPDTPNQLGFKKGAQTADHILTLKTIIEKHTKPGKKLHACFVDFRKAFDSVAREALLYKIAVMGIGGNVFQTLRNMYENTSTRIKLINKLSEHIDLKNGVEQGHPLSPELFKIFIHELSASLNKITKKVPMLNNTHISHLFWADDLVLLSLNEDTLQILVNVLGNFCTEWGLTVNLKKTKILIFNKSGRYMKPTNPILLFGTPIETTRSYCYLGIVFVPSGKFKTATLELKKKAIRAIFKLRAAVLKHNISTTCLFKLFDALILPILTSCSQVLLPESQFYKCIISAVRNDNWKQQHLAKISKDPFESVHLSYIKWVLGVHKKTTNLACWYETGRFPLGIAMSKLFFNYNVRCRESADDTLVFHTVEAQKLHPFQWHIAYDKLNSVFSPTPNSKLSDHKSPQNLLVTGMKTMFTAICTGALQQTKKLQVLKTLKDSWGAEPYLDSLSYRNRVNITRLRVSAHFLPIETGRYSRPTTPQEERYCKICEKVSNVKTLGDERHLLFDCIISYPKRQALRGKLKDSITNHDIKATFTGQDKDLKDLAIYINKIYNDYLDKIKPKLTKTDT